MTGKLHFDRHIIKNKELIMSKNIDLANDKLVLGGHEFTSRFILGSGKFSLDLVKGLH